MRHLRDVYELRKEMDKEDKKGRQTSETESGKQGDRFERRKELRKKGFAVTDRDRNKGVVIEFYASSVVALFLIAICSKIKMQSGVE